MVSHTLSKNAQLISKVDQIMLLYHLMEKVANLCYI